MPASGPPAIDRAQWRFRNPTGVIDQLNSSAPDAELRGSTAKGTSTLPSALMGVDHAAAVTLQSNVSEVAPIRVSKDVGDEDRVPQVSGCAA